MQFNKNMGSNESVAINRPITQKPMTKIHYSSEKAVGAWPDILNTFQKCQRKFSWFADLFQNPLKEDHNNTLVERGDLNNHVEI